MDLCWFGATSAGAASAGAVELGGGFTGPDLFADVIFRADGGTFGVLNCGAGGGCLGAKSIKGSCGADNSSTCHPFLSAAKEMSVA